MSHSLGKRRADSTGAEDMSILGSATNLNSKQTQFLQDLPVPPPCYPDHRRLQFQYGASITFKVLYAIATINGGGASCIEEKINNIHDAKKVLHEAHELSRRFSSQTVNKDDVTQLEQLLYALKYDSVLENQVREKLREHQQKPAWVYLDSELDRWHDYVCSLLKHSEALRDTFNIEEDLHATVDAVGRFHHELLNKVTRTAPSRYPKPVMREQAEDYSYLTRIIGQALRDIRKGEAVCRDSTNEKFLHIYQTYETLYDVMQSDPDDVFHDKGLSELAHAFSFISKQLQSLLAQPQGERCLKDRYVDRVLDEFCRGHCHALISLAGARVRDKVLGMLADLEARAAEEHIDMRLEQQFTDTATSISRFALPTPLGIDESEWVKYAPRMLPLQLGQDLMNKLQYLYASYQDRTYNSHELSQLWLIVWRGLKATYCNLRKDNFTRNRDAFPAEAAFFQRQSVLNQFELVLAGPEALHPRVVENIVAQYCTEIAEARMSANSVYGMLKQFQPNNNISDLVFQVIQSFVDTNEWNDLAIRGIEKCTVRLNSIVNGPAFIRRRDDRYMAPKVRSATDWVFDKVALGIAMSDDSILPQGLQFTTPSATQTVPATRVVTTKATPPATSIPSRVTDASSFWSTRNSFDKNASTRGTDLDDEMDIDMDPEVAALGGMHAVSSYDYAIYPFPETRALEVAQSRQIEREMSSSGIYSPGALVHDVVNRPPRHTWPPGVVSIWGKSLPVGPIDVLKDVWSELRKDESKVRTTFQQAKPFPRITPRTPRKNWVDEHPRLRPLLDSRTKISKKATHTRKPQRNTHHDPQHQQRTQMMLAQFGPVPKLRGGGPNKSSSQPGDTNNTDKNSQTAANATSQTANTNPLSTTEQQARVQQLLDRMQGLWRHGEVPPNTMVRDQLLAPNNWNVDLAYAAARRFANMVIPSSASAEGDAPGAIATQNLTRTSNAGLPRGPADPFVDTTTDPNLSRNLARNGMQMSQNNRLPRGTHGHRPPPTSPTPLGRSETSRQTQLLNSVLPAHLNPSQSGQFQIREDTPGRPTPTINRPSDTGYSPAPNQEHQAQLERQRAGLPPLGTNNSSQENTTPRPPNRVPLGSLRAPSLPQQVATATCNARRCHACPVYSGLFHHMCTHTSQQPAIVASPVAGALFTSFGISDTTTTWQPDNSQAGSSFRVRPAVNDDNPSPLGSANTNNQSRLNRFASVAPDSAQQSGAAAVNPAPTRIAGHNLRNRTRLAQQRAARNHSDDGDDDDDNDSHNGDTQQPAKSTAAEIQVISSNVTSAITNAVNTLVSAASAAATANNNSNTNTVPVTPTNNNPPGPASSSSSDAESSSDDNAPVAKTTRGRGRGRPRGRPRGTPAPARGGGRGATPDTQATTTTTASTRGTATKGRGTGGPKSKGTGTGRGAGKKG